jgi:hypothetical protein
MSGVMVGLRPSLRVLEGSIADGVRSEKIALSFVHPAARLDVPVRAIRWIEARESFTYLVKGVLFESPNSHVEVCLRADFAMRLYKLTQQIVGDAIEIRVESKCVSKPKVLQPIGWRGRFAISIFDFDEAQAVAAEMRARCGITGPRLVQQ